MTVFHYKPVMKRLVAGLVLAHFAYGVSVSAAVSTQAVPLASHQTGQMAELVSLKFKALDPLPLTAFIKKPVSHLPSAQAPERLLDQAEASAKDIIAYKESGGSYTAQNGRYYGRYQLDMAYLNGDFSPENQERIAQAYVVNRYGSWSAALLFWQENGWY